MWIVFAFVAALVAITFTHWIYTKSDTIRHYKERIEDAAREADDL